MVSGKGVPGSRAGRRRFACLESGAMRIAAHHLVVLIDMLRLHGLDVRPWLGNAGLPGCFAGVEGEMRPAQELDLLTELALRHGGDPGIGLVAATSLAQARHGPVVPLMMHSPDLRAALADLVRYSPLMQDQPELSCELQGTLQVLRLSPLGGREVIRRFRAEQTMGGLATLLRYNQVGPGELQRLCFTHARPSYAARYAAVFGLEPQFGQPTCELAFPAELLDRPQPHRDAAAYAEARARADAALAAVSRPRPVVDDRPRLPHAQARPATSPAPGSAAG